MAITLETVGSSRELEEFVNLPFHIHNKSTPWVGPLKKQQLELLDPARHPFWQTARRQIFLARRDGQAVGGIAAIVDEKYNDYAGQKCGAFGFFECQNDRDAAFQLLDAARKWLADQGMAFMRGPLNPSTNYTCGLLVGGFELDPALMMPWNPPYYAEFLESWGLRKERDLFAYRMDRQNISLADWLKDEIGRLKQENNFTCRPSSKATMSGDIGIMLEIYRLSWADNWGFSPLSPAEEANHVKDLKSLVDPDFFTLFFHKGEPAGGMVALPDLNPLLKRLDGSLGITLPYHWWKSRRQIRGGYRIMLFGILPKYRLWGLPLLLFDYMLSQAAKKPEFEWVEGSWVLEDNAAIDDLIEDFGGKLAKRYRIYRREIA